MAVIKAVNSRASLGRVIKYITQDEKTLECLIGGYNCRGISALFEMKATKKGLEQDRRQTVQALCAEFFARRRYNTAAGARNSRRTCGELGEI